MYPPSGVYSDSYSKDTAVVRTRVQWILLLLLLAVVFTIPLYTSEHTTRLAIEIAIVLVAVQGLNILTGYCGQINIGQSAFMMAGAFASGLLSNMLGLSFWITLPVAGIVAGLIGVLFGLPSLRVKGLYLALTTLAAQFIITYVCLYHMPAGAGTSGFSAEAPRIGNFVFDTTLRYYYIVIVICVVSILVAKNIARSGLGRAFTAIRDNDKAAEAIGINIFSHKLIAFAICTFYAGIAGALLAHYLQWVQTESFTFVDSVWFLGMLIVGGMGSAVGPIFGVIFLTLLKHGMLTIGPMIEMAGFPIGAGSGMVQCLFGLVILLFLIYEPRGLAHRWGVFKASYRLWPFAY